MRVKNGLLWLIASLAVLAVSTIEPAYAVATVEVTVTDGQRPLPEQQVVLLDPDGQAVKEDERRGGVWLWRNLSKTGTYTVRAGDRVVQRIQVPATGEIKVTANPNTGQVANASSGVAAANPYSGFALGVGGGWKRLSYDVEGTLGFSSGGSSTIIDEAAASVRDNGATLGLLGRWYGAIPNTGFRHYFGLEWWRPSLRETINFGDVHPPFGEDDTGVRFRENWYARAVFGAQIVALQAWSLWAFGGVQYTDVELEAFSDESGGGGSFERFKKQRGLISPVLGLEMMVPLGSSLNLGLGVSATRLGDLSVGGMSSFTGLDYRARFEDAWQTDATLRFLDTF